MSLKSDLRTLLKPYYLINIFLSVSYTLMKRVPLFCYYVFSQENCEISGRESEILFFLIIVIMIRTRKAGSVTMINYLTASFVYTKVANLILWFNADIHLGILYAVIFILCGLVCPEPTYQGPENITYLRGIGSLEEELQRDTRVTWLVAFYTAWNPTCVTFAPIFSQLSAKYALENLRFGKVDVGAFPKAAAEYRISDSSSSKQLPTIILFKDGKEVNRRPFFDNKGRISKFLFSLENIKEAFNLNYLYDTCKNNPIPKKKEKKTLKSD